MKWRLAVLPELQVVGDWAALTRCCLRRDREAGQRDWQCPLQVVDPGADSRHPYAMLLEQVRAKGGRTVSWAGLGGEEMV